VVSATALVVAAMVGTGVFTTSGFLLADLGSPWLVLLAWITGGVVALLGATCYGALAGRIPESGGEYVYLSHTLHPAAGWLGGWVSFFVGFVAPLATAAMAFAAYARPWLPPGMSERTAATLLLVTAAALHATSLRWAARVHSVAVIVEVLFIIAFALFGITRVDVPPISPLPDFRLGPFAVSLVWIAFAYTGWNSAVYVAGEVRDPERTVRRAMWFGTALVAILYGALNAVFVFSAPSAELAGRLDLARVAAEAIGGPRLGAAASVLASFVLVTFVSSMTMSGPHVSARMARDGYLPGIFASPPGQPPRAAMAVALAVALILVWTSAFDSMLTYVGFTLGLSTAATVLGLVRLRVREGPSVRVVGWPWVPALFLVFVLGSTAFTVVQRPRESAVGVGGLVIGLLAFRLHPRRGGPG
jgi:APA family basic amino acid/polyamine antiporter